MLAAHGTVPVNNYYLVTTSIYYHLYELNKETAS